jgi:hypothetical protein
MPEIRNVLLSYSQAIAIIQAMIAAENEGLLDVKNSRDALESIEQTFPGVTARADKWGQIKHWKV